MATEDKEQWDDALIKIVMMTGQRFEIHPESPTFTILNIKEAIHEQMEDILVQSMNLNYKGKFLANARTLADCGIEGTVTMRCIIRIRKVLNIGENNLQGHTAVVRYCDTSTSDSFIISASADGKCKIWDSGTGECRKTLDNGMFIMACRISKDEKLIITGDRNGNTRVWDVESGEIVEDYFHGGIIFDLDISYNGTYIVSGYGNGMVNLINRNENRVIPTQKIHTNQVRGIRCAPNNEYFVSGCASNILCIWDFDGNVLFNTRKVHTSFIQKIAISHNSEVIATCSYDATIKLWNKDELLKSDPNCVEPKLTLHGHAGAVYGVDFNKGDNLILSGGSDATVKVWKIETGECIETFTDHSKQIWCVKFGNYFDNLIISASSDNSIRLRNR